MATKGVRGDCGETANEPNTIVEDRISELPDALIHYIFSFLPTIYIVQICLLRSKKRASYDDVVHFLSNLSGLKKMMLSLNWEMEMIFPESIRNAHCPPLPDLKHLKVEVDNELKKKSEVEDSLF